MATKIYAIVDLSDLSAEHWDSFLESSSTVRKNDVETKCIVKWVGATPAIITTLGVTLGLASLEADGF